MGKQAHPREAPHLDRIGDWWYLLIAEGGTERGHGVSIARARSPRGPWEGAPANPLLSHIGTDGPSRAPATPTWSRRPTASGGWCCAEHGVDGLLLPVQARRDEEGGVIRTDRRGGAVAHRWQAVHRRPPSLCLLVVCAPWRQPG
ncbi:family 43 glycosylhydrolase [Streptomyces sp. NBC_01589]|uniref:family 43 glycosylhydrolase n=1 Tax=unclassified Streptomyces TaxID=2593676 RepID=UPI003868A1A0